jgi:hypothetical protein
VNGTAKEARWIWWAVVNLAVVLYVVNAMAFTRWGVWHPDSILASTLLFALATYKLLQSPRRVSSVRRRVYVETPFRADDPAGLRRNREYLLRCMRDCLDRGESPFASHLLYTHFLNDDVPAERDTGIVCGFAWASVADATVVYTDHGISFGMKLGINDARFMGRPIEYRSIEEEAS